MQEPGAGNVITYPRNLEGVVRKKDDRRRTAREARVERKAAEAAAMEEEVKRRKAEKRRELDQRCAANRAGIVDLMHLPNCCEPRRPECSGNGNLLCWTHCCCCWLSPGLNDVASLCSALVNLLAQVAKDQGCVGGRSREQDADKVAGQGGLRHGGV
jgi:hypothetical protein